MGKVIGIRFKNKGKIYHFDSGDLELKIGDEVIIESERGPDFAEICSIHFASCQGSYPKPLKKILRKVTEEDFQKLEKNRALEKEAFRFCLERIKERGMEMKLVDTETAFDGSKLTFYFTSEGRIDFRELVKELAQRFRARIEMRQIGVRDEARMTGGYGPCGYSLCCTTFLRDFEPVSIRMAREQDLVLNPAKISGICGRLMCCIGFEYNSCEQCPKTEEAKEKVEIPTDGATEKIVAKEGEPVASGTPQRQISGSFKKKRRRRRWKKNKNLRGGNPQNA